MRTSDLVARACARLRDERGITIVEAIIAASILLIGLISGFLSLESAQSAAKTAERQAVAAAEAERQIEKLQAKSWDDLVMCSAPTQNVNPGAPPGHVPENPDFYVQGGNPVRFKVLANYREPNSGPLAGTPNNGEEIVVPSGAAPAGCVPPSPVSFTSGTTSGTYYRYVTWRDDTCVVGLPANLGNLVANLTSVVSSLVNSIGNQVNTNLNVFCATTRDAKRITVAVVLDDASDYGPHKPTWISTIQTNVDDGLIINVESRFDF